MCVWESQTDRREKRRGGEERKEERRGGEMRIGERMLPGGWGWGRAGGSARKQTAIFYGERKRLRKRDSPYRQTSPLRPSQLTATGVHIPVHWPLRGGGHLTITLKDTLTK